VLAVDYRLVLGVNDRAELATACATMNERLCREHMRNGVTIVDPATTYLEPEVIIGADSIVRPNTSIGGASVLGERTRIGPNARLYNARLGDDVIVTESVVLDFGNRRAVESRSVRALARRQRTRQRRAHRRFCRSQELSLGQRREGEPSRILGRCDDRREHEHRAGTITC